MHCPDTGGTCFDLDCQTLGCQGDSIRRQLNQTNIDGREMPHPIPRHTHGSPSPLDTRTFTAAKKKVA